MHYAIRVPDAGQNHADIWSQAVLSCLKAAINGPMCESKFCLVVLFEWPEIDRWRQDAVWKTGEGDVEDYQLTEVGDGVRLRKGTGEALMEGLQHE